MSTATLYAVSHVTGSASSPDNALGAPDGVWTADGNANASWTSRWRLDVVAGAFTPSGTQTVILRVRKGTNSGNPSIATVTLWQGGTQVATISSGAVTVTSTTGVDQSYTFAGSLLSGFTDVDIQVAITAAGGGGTVRNSVELDAITWNTAYVAAGPPIDVALAATETPDTTAVALAARHDLSLAVTEAADVTGFAISLPLDPAFEGEAFIETAFYATSSLRELDFAATETPDTTAVALAARHEIALVATETPDTTAVALAARHDLALAATETPDTTAVALAARHEIALVATETPDTTAVALAARHEIALAATEAPDTTAVALAARHDLALAVTEAPDTTAVALAARHELALAVTEAQDTTDFDVGVLDGAVLAATETPDTTAADLSIYWTVNLAANESPDTTSIEIIRAVPFDVDAGAVTFTGNDAILAADRFIYPDAGQMNIAGLPVNLAYFRAITAGSQAYVITGYSARLYQSSFFYNDTEITFAPQEVRALTIYFEDRVIRVPANPDIKRLAEYREADGEPRLRAI
jgi:hypothetical protein